MEFNYNVIEIFTSEDVKYQGKPIATAIIDCVRNSKIAARCIVSKAIAGCYENGEVASNNIELLSYNMPLKIEIILPSAELDMLLPKIEELVVDGIIAVEDMAVKTHRTTSKLIPSYLRVKDVMTANPICVTESTTAGEILTILLGANFNVVPVVDSNKRPIGIITQGDLIKKAGVPIHLGLLAEFEKSKVEQYLEGVASKKAKEFMSSPVKTVFEDKLLSEAVDRMIANNLKRMPVVNKEGHITGMLSRLDIFKIITAKTPDWKRFKNQNVKVSDIKYVRDIMERDIHTVKKNTPVDEIIRFIDSNEIEHVAVIDDSGHLVGIISDRDIVGFFAEHKAGLIDYLLARLPLSEISKRHEDLIKKTKMKIAADVMKSDLITVSEEARIDEAINLMVKHVIKLLPVVDENNIFKGMISRDALLRAGLHNN